MTRRVNFFHHQLCRPIAIFIDLEGVGMDNFLGPRGANVWKFGVEELEGSGIGIGTD
jgi:hypothetical protein